MRPNFICYLPVRVHGEEKIDNATKMFLHGFIERFAVPVL
jgi:hypothetical protein